MAPDVAHASVMEKYATSYWDLHSCEGVPLHATFVQQYKLLGALECLALRRGVSLNEICSNSEYKNITNRCNKPVGVVPSYEELTEDPALAISGQATNMATVHLSVNEPELVRLGHARLCAAVQAVFPVNNKRDAANKAMWVKREIAKFILNDQKATLVPDKSTTLIFGGGGPKLGTALKALWRNQSIFDPSEVPYTGLKGVVEQDPLFYIHTSTKQPPAIGLSIEAVLQAASALGVQPDLPPGPSDVSNGRPAPRPEASVATPVARHTHTGAVDPILPAPGYYPTYLDGGNNVLQGVSLNQMLKTAEEVFEPLASLEGFTLCEITKAIIRLAFACDPTDCMSYGILHARAGDVVITAWRQHGAAYYQSNERSPYESLGLVNILSSDKCFTVCPSLANKSVMMVKLHVKSFVMRAFKKQKAASTSLSGPPSPIAPSNISRPANGTASNGNHHSSSNGTVTPVAAAAAAAAASQNSQLQPTSQLRQTPWQEEFRIGGVPISSLGLQPYESPKDQNYQRASLSLIHSVGPAYSAMVARLLLCARSGPLCIKGELIVLPVTRVNEMGDQETVMGAPELVLLKIYASQVTVQGGDGLSSIEGPVVFILDLQIPGKAKEMLDGGLREILESPSTIKIVAEGRQLLSILESPTHQLKMANVLDVNALRALDVFSTHWAHANGSSSADSRGASAADLMGTSTFAELLFAYGMVMPAGGTVEARMREQPMRWRIRPLTPDLLEFSAIDVQFLLPLAQSILMRMSPRNPSGPAQINLMPQIHDAVKFWGRMLAPGMCE